VGNEKSAPQPPKGPEPDLQRRLVILQNLYGQAVIDIVAKDAYIGQLLDLVPNPPEMVTASPPEPEDAPAKTKLRKV
jgi:hypothetical protein